MQTARRKGSGEVDMCNGPLFPKIVTFFIPVMLTNLLQSLYSAADQAVVGQFAQNGAEALGSIGSTSAVTNLLVCLVTGLAVGTSSVVARLFGAGNKNAVHRAVHSSIVIAVIMGTIIGVLGFVLSRPILTFMGTQPELLDGSVLYMRISFAGLPVVAVYNYGSAILRAVGDARRPMIYLMISGVINVVLNIIFVAGFGMSVDGVALATIISQAVSCVLTIRCLMMTDGSCKLSLKKLRLHKEESKSILYVGIPAGLQSSLFGISNTLLQSSLNSINTLAVSGSTAASTIENFVYMPMNALYHTSLAFCSQNYGAGKNDRIKKSFGYCSLIAVVFGLVLGAVVCLFGESLLGIFLKSEPAAVPYGKQRLYMVCITYFICGIMESATGALRGINQAIPALVSTVFFTCIMRVIWCKTVFPINPNVTVLFVVYPITWLLTTACQVVMFFIFFSKLKKINQSQ